MKHNRTELPIFPKEYKKIKWKAPFLFAHDKLFFCILKIIDELGINLPIDSVFGGIPCRWDTNRIPCDIYKDNDIVNSIQKYNQHKISCCFTFNNFDITKEMLYDEIPNKILKIASEQEYDNYAIISSDLLYTYIKENYPNIKLISSVVRPSNECLIKKEIPQYYNELCEKYDRVVIRAELNFNDKFLKKLKYKNKIEILANNICVFNCKFRSFHYRRLSEMNMTDKNYAFCNKKINDIEYIHNNTLLSKNDILRLQKLGFKHFKLDGRWYDDKTLFDNVIARYIFEATGIIQPLRTILVNNGYYNG